MTEPEINTTNAVNDEDDNAEAHTGDRIPDADEQPDAEEGAGE